jgi:two-component system sensor histidine kinase CreC
MSTRNRVFIGILLIYVVSVALVLYNIISDLDPRYRESAEESLVETSHFLASAIEQDMTQGDEHLDSLRATFKRLYAKRFHAQIFSLSKDRVEMRVYVTDRSGIVIFDSLDRVEGQDYSQWRDVSQSLHGLYGARTTPDIPNDKNTAVMYVGAPIEIDNATVGVVTVGKPVQSFGQFVEAARRKIVVAGIIAVVAFILLALIVSVWLVRPFGILADYVKYVRAQRQFSLPRLSRRAIGVIGAAYTEMRDALAGRHYVSEYVQTLTHEIKSPLSAIRGAAELLQEPMPDEARTRFLRNITREAQRIQELVDRLLELSALETRSGLDQVATVDLNKLVEDALQTAQPTAAQRAIVFNFTPSTDAMLVEGNAFLLQRAIANLLDNAIDFSPAAGRIDISLFAQVRSVILVVRDFGVGIPDFAINKVFEKFYSLARPHTNRKGTGLGLAFVREITELHQGRITLSNADGGGARATLELPRAS